MASLTQIEGKYEILEKLHEGGMGSIYRVQHRLLQEQRVVKTMRRQLAEDAQFRNRFLQEAQLAASLKHPNIAQIHDFTVDDTGTGLIVMEYIDGVSCKEILEATGPPDLALTFELARQALRALGFLHRKGYVHRDISPDNVMLAEDVDGQPEAKLIDLGIAKKLGGGDGLTTTGHFLGKLRYSSPEHFGTKGAAGADERSDVYSFGLVLYELLTGQPAVLGNDLPSLSAGHLLRPPQSFEETDPGERVPESLRLLVLRALAKDPTLRFADGEAFGQALAEVQAIHPLPPSFAVANVLEPVRAQRRREHGYELEGSDPGSTQVRFDRQFGVETTPAGRRSEEGSGSRSRKPPGLLLHEEPSTDEDTGVYHTVSGDPVSPGATVAMPLSGAGQTRRIPDIAAHLASSGVSLDPGATQPALDLGKVPPPPPLPGTSPSDLESGLQSDVEPEAHSSPEPKIEVVTEYVEAEAPPPLEPEVPVEMREEISDHRAAGSPAVESSPQDVLPVSSDLKEERAEKNSPKSKEQTEKATKGRSGLTVAFGLVGFVALAGILLWMFGGSEPEVAETRPPAPPKIEPVPPPHPEPSVETEPELHPELVAARKCLSEGDAECARLAIETLKADAVYLTDKENEELAAITAEVEAIEAVLAESTADLEALGQKLVESLTNGPVTQLRDAIDALKKVRVEDREAFDGLGEEVLDAFARGDKVIIQYRRMWGAKNKDLHLEVIPQADRLLEIYPPYADSAAEHRETAVSAITSEAVELEAAGDLLGAASLLRALLEATPGRPGLEERIAGLEGRRERKEVITRTLAGAEALYQARRPEEGLALLADLKLAPSNPAAKKVAELKERFRDLYADMDRNPPQIALATGTISYRRREPIRVELSITDDYQVYEVKAFARPDDRDAAFREVSVQHEGDSKYVFEIEPELHDNERNVFYFVEAMDSSGHSTSFGTKAMPKVVRRGR